MKKPKAKADYDYLAERRADLLCDLDAYEFAIGNEYRKLSKMMAGRGISCRDDAAKYRVWLLGNDICPSV